MEINGILVSSLTSLLTNLPLLIIWIVGIVIAIVRWKKSPRRSLLALIAFVIMMGIHIVSVIFGNSFYLLASVNGMNYRMVSTISVIVNVFFSLVNTAGWVLVLLAIFGKSKGTNTADPSNS